MTLTQGNLDELNSELTAAYETALARWAAGSKPSECSKPLLLRIPRAYHTTSIKLLVVGQQTAGWGEDRSLTAVDLMQGYDEWQLGAGYQSTPFWRTAHQLFRDLNPDTSGAGGFLWSNLVKVDVAGQRPHPDVEEQICNLRLLETEITIAKPDVIVFFTGPDYDGRLAKTFPRLDLLPIATSVPLRKLARVEHRNLPKRSFRTYHPRYLLGKEPWVLQQLRDVIRVPASEPEE